MATRRAILKRGCGDVGAASKTFELGSEQEASQPGFFLGKNVPIRTRKAGTNEQKNHDFDRIQQGRFGQEVAISLNHQNVHDVVEVDRKGALVVLTIKRVLGGDKLVLNMTSVAADWLSDQITLTSLMTKVGRDNFFSVP